jgi:Cysteine-rich secretory protein family
MYKKVSIGIITILAAAAILTVPSSELQVSYAQPNQDLANKILKLHNSERAAVNVAPLTWNENLAAGAQTWATHLATTGQFIHDPVNAVPKGPHGENIAGFFSDVSEPNGGQSKWADEKSSYDGGPCGDPPVYRPSSCGKASGHYTQMVWQNTKAIGCGTAPPNGQPAPGGHAFSILVCRYDPPGNYAGQMPYPAAAPPSQAVGDEESTFAPPVQEGVGGVGGGDTSGDGGGGDTSGDGGGGDTSGDGGGNEN